MSAFYSALPWILGALAVLILLAVLIELTGPPQEDWLTPEARADHLKLLRSMKAKGRT